MEERYMVNDALDSIKLEFNFYQNAICNTQIKGYYSEDEK